MRVSNYRTPLTPCLTAGRPEGGSAARLTRLCILLLLCAFAPLRDLKAQYTIEQVDSLTSRLCTTTWAPDGSVSKSCSQPYKGDTTRTMLFNIAQQKKAYIDAAPWVREWAMIDSSLKRYTGRTYDMLVADQIASVMVGDWHVSYLTDTIDIKISKDLKVTGGKIRGTMSVVDPNSIRLDGVLPSPVVISSDRKRLFGKIGKDEVVMWRSGG